MISGLPENEFHDLDSTVLAAIAAAAALAHRNRRGPDGAWFRHLWWLYFLDRISSSSFDAGPDGGVQLVVKLGWGRTADPDDKQCCRTISARQRRRCGGSLGLSLSCGHSLVSASLQSYDHHSHRASFPGGRSRTLPRTRSWDDPLVAISRMYFGWALSQ